MRTLIWGLPIALILTACGDDSGSCGSGSGMTGLTFGGNSASSDRLTPELDGCSGNNSTGGPNCIINQFTGLCDAN